MSSGENIYFKKHDQNAAARFNVSLAERTCRWRRGVRRHKYTIEEVAPETQQTWRPQRRPERQRLPLKSLNRFSAGIWTKLSAGSGSCTEPGTERSPTRVGNVRFAAAGKGCLKPALASRSSLCTAHIQSVSEVQR